MARKKKPANARPARTFDDGKMTFRVRSGDAPPRDIALDLIQAKLICESCESQHNLQVSADGYYIPTAAFVGDLARELSSATGEEITPTLAYHLWPAITARMLELKKNMSGTPI